jgi:hypothetical protein
VAKHTPGPWRVGALTSRGATIYHPTDKTDKSNPDIIVAYSVENATTVIGKEAKANAYLIAAAPELVAELEAELESLNEWLHEEELSDELKGAMLVREDKIQTLLRKAVPEPTRG